MLKKYINIFICEKKDEKKYLIIASPFIYFIFKSFFHNDYYLIVGLDNFKNYYFEINYYNGLLTWSIMNYLESSVKLVKLP